jgi:hypothetical protein
MRGEDDEQKILDSLETPGGYMRYTTKESFRVIRAPSRFCNWLFAGLEYNGIFPMY